MISMRKPDSEALVERARDLFKQGYNCSQSVVVAFSEYYGIPEPLMARFSASFGGGIGRMRETCGAACGMFMLTGLEVGMKDEGLGMRDYSNNPYPNQELKKQNYEAVQLLASRFREETGSLLCRELLGLNKKRADGTIPEIQIIPTPEARTDEYYRKRPCIRMVETAVRVYCRFLCERLALDGLV